MPIKLQMKTHFLFLQKLARDCSKNPKCICSRDSFGTVNVTCKNANLTHLPKSLPPKTTTLDVSNNQVKLENMNAYVNHLILPYFPIIILISFNLI